jgi:hypothetical protein
LGLLGFVRKIVRGVRAVSGGDGTFAVQSFKFFSSRRTDARRRRLALQLAKGIRDTLEVRFAGVAA